MNPPVNFMECEMILVTGATGTIGSHLVRTLTTQGVPVRAFVRNLDKARGLLPGAELAQGDLSQPASLKAALKGVDRLFLLTSGSSDQVALQNGAVDVAKAAGVRHIVKVSAAGTHPESPISLARWHAETESYIKASGVPFTHLHPTFFMQNLLGSAGSIKEQGAFYLPAGDGKASVIDARDIGEVAAVALTTERLHGQTLLLTGGEALGYADMAAQLSAEIGRPVNYVAVPPEAARQNMLAGGMPSWYVEDLLKLMAYFASGNAAGVSPAVAEILGHAPRTFARFAADHRGAFLG